MASLPCHQVNLGTEQICDRDFSFEAMFSTKRAQRKTLSGSEVIGLQVVHLDDRIVCYVLPQLNYNQKLSLLVWWWWCVCAGGGGLV